MKSIKIDGSFPEYGTKLLAEALSSGWRVFDKNILGERYIVYILKKDEDTGNAHP